MRCGSYYWRIVGCWTVTVVQWVTERRYKFSVRTGSNNYDVKFAAAEEKGSYKHKTQSSDCDLCSDISLSRLWFVRVLRFSNPASDWGFTVTCGPVQ